MSRTRQHVGPRALTQAHAHTHTYTSTRKNAHTLTLTRSHTHTHACKPTHPLSRTHTHAHAHKHAPMPTWTHARTHMHEHAHKNMDTCTHSFAHIAPPSPSPLSPFSPLLSTRPPTPTNQNQAPAHAPVHPLTAEVPLRTRSPFLSCIVPALHHSSIRGQNNSKLERFFKSLIECPDSLLLVVRPLYA